MRQSAARERPPTRAGDRRSPYTAACRHRPAEADQLQGRGSSTSCNSCRCAWKSAKAAAASMSWHNSRSPCRQKRRSTRSLNKLRSQLTRILCGDPLPDHAAALLRRVGTHNSKYEGEPRLVRVLQEAEPVDSIDLEELVELLGNARLFTPLPKSNGHDQGHSRPRAVVGSQPAAADVHRMNTSPRSTLNSAWPQ